MIEGMDINIQDIRDWLDTPIGSIDSDFEVAIAYVQWLLAENERLQEELAQRAVTVATALRDSGGEA